MDQFLCSLLASVRPSRKLEAGRRVRAFYLFVYLFILDLPPELLGHSNLIMSLWQRPQPLSGGPPTVGGIPSLTHPPSFGLFRPRTFMTVALVSHGLVEPHLCLHKQSFTQLFSITPVEYAFVSCQDLDWSPPWLLLRKGNKLEDAYLLLLSPLCSLSIKTARPHDLCDKGMGEELSSKKG